jgi:hypothetical protein
LGRFFAVWMIITCAGLGTILQHRCCAVTLPERRP